MPREAFLINPPRRAGARRRSMKRNVWSGNTGGHKKASRTGWKRRKSGKSGYAIASGYAIPTYNPIGGEVVLVGTNPKRRKRRRKNVARRVYARRNPVVRRRKRTYRRRRNPVALTTRRSYRRRRNPVSRIRRRRRNPATALAMGSFSGINVRKPLTLVMPIATAIVSKIAADKLPMYLNANTPLQRAGVQAGLMLAGGMLLPKVIGKGNAIIFAVVAGASAATEILNNYVFNRTMGYFPSYPDYSAKYGSVGAFPREFGMGAFPKEYAY